MYFEVQQKVLIVHREFGVRIHNTDRSWPLRATKPKSQNDRHRKKGYFLSCPLVGYHYLTPVASHMGATATEYFSTTIATPQGDSLPPIMFYMYLEAALRKVRAKLGPRFPLLKIALYKPSGKTYGKIIGYVKMIRYVEIVLFVSQSQQYCFRHPFHHQCDHYNGYRSPHLPKVLVSIGATDPLKMWDRR